MTLTDVKTLRAQARQHLEDGAVTAGYSADRAQVLGLLNEALATEMVCVLRYRRHHSAPDRGHAEYVAGASLIEMIREDLVAERIAIDSYLDALRYLGDQDPTTSEMLKAILGVEERHADELAGLLTDLPVRAS